MKRANRLVAQVACNLNFSTNCTNFIAPVKWKPDYLATPGSLVLDQFQYCINLSLSIIMRIRVATLANRSEVYRGSLLLFYPIQYTYV